MGQLYINEQGELCLTSQPFYNHHQYTGDNPFKGADGTVFRYRLGEHLMISHRKELSSKLSNLDNDPYDYLMTRLEHNFKSIDTHMPKDFLPRDWSQLNKLISQNHHASPSPLQGGVNALLKRQQANTYHYIDPSRVSGNIVREGAKKLRQNPKGEAFLQKLSQNYRSIIFFNYYYLTKINSNRTFLGTDGDGLLRMWASAKPSPSIALLFEHEFKYKLQQVLPKNKDTYTLFYLYNTFTTQSDPFYLPSDPDDPAEAALICRDHGTSANELLESYGECTESTKLYELGLQELQYLHTLGLLHGDAKIDNLLIHSGYKQKAIPIMIDFEHAVSYKEIEQKKEPGHSDKPSDILQYNSFCIMAQVILYSDDELLYKQLFTATTLAQILQIDISTVNFKNYDSANIEERFKILQKIEELAFTISVAYALKKPNPIQNWLFNLDKEVIKLFFQGNDEEIYQKIEQKLDIVSKHFFPAPQASSTNCSGSTGDIFPLNNYFKQAYFLDSSPSPFIPDSQLPVIFSDQCDHLTAQTQVEKTLEILTQSSTLFSAQQPFLIINLTPLDIVATTTHEGGSLTFQRTLVTLFLSGVISGWMGYIPDAEFGSINNDMVIPHHADFLSLLPTKIQALKQTTQSDELEEAIARKIYMKYHTLFHPRRQSLIEPQAKYHEKCIDIISSSKRELMLYQAIEYQLKNKFPNRIALFEAYQKQPTHSQSNQSSPWHGRSQACSPTTLGNASFPAPPLHSHSTSPRTQPLMPLSE